VKLTNSITAAHQADNSFHAHDYVLIVLVAVLAILFFRFMVAKTRDRKSPIDVSELWCDDITHRISWLKVIGGSGVMAAGAVLLQQALSGKDVTTIFGIWCTTVIAPTLTNIVAQTIKSMPQSPAPLPAPAPIGPVQNINLTKE
jgi:ABC-type phosphate transport system permease subunit